MSQRTKLQKMLKKAGFTLARKKRHFVYKNEAGATITVPNHNKINKFTYDGIVKQIKLVS